MAAPAAVLSILLTANTNGASRGILRVNQQLDATQGKAHKATDALKTFAKVGVIGVGVGLGYAVKKAADFEQQLDSLGSVAGATGRQMETLRKQAMKAGADTKFSALEAAKAQTELAKGGLKVKQILDGGLNSALALAAAGEMDLADAASTTANALNLFGLKGKNAMKVADMLAKAANETTADVSDFAMALSQGGSVAKSAGLSFKETVLALEALAKSGIKNSDAGTSLKTAMIQLIKPTGKQRELAKKLNLEFIDQAGHFKDLGDISAMLRDRLGDMTKAQRTAVLATLAGTDGVRTLTALYDAGQPRLDKWAKGLDKQGTAAEVAAKKQDNFKGKLENLKGSIETAAIAIGTKMLPALTKAAEEITDVLNDRKLTSAEKFTKLAEMAGKAFEDIIPVIADHAAKAAPVAAKAFVTGFLAAGVWGRLAVAGFLLAKMGGVPAFMKVGQQAGVATGSGMAAGMAKSGLKGKLIGLMGSWGPALGVALAATLGPELVKSLEHVKGARPEARAKDEFKGIPKTATASVEDFTAATDKARDAVRSATHGTNRMHASVGILKQQADEAAAEIDRLAAPTLEKLVVNERRVTGMSDRFAAALKGLRIKGTKDFSGLVDEVTFGSKQILKVGGEKSQKTREAVSRQFDIARQRIRDHFRGPDGVVHMSKAGYGALHQLAVKELGLYGIKAGRVNVVLAKGANGEMRPNARGGFQTGGKPVGDSIPSLLERGEYVVNRRAVSKVGKRALDRLNFGMAPRFQAGGMVDPAWDPGSERLAAGISGRVGQWAKRFQANMTAGYDPGGGHVSPGHNVTGTATDMVPLAGNWDLLEKGLRVLVAAGTKVLYGSNGIGTPWPNHGRGNHAHIEWGTGGGFSMFNGLKRVALSGPASAALEVAQGGLDRVRGAANAAINRAVMFSTEGTEGGSNFKGGAFDKRALRSLWSSVNPGIGNPNLMAAIALAESSGNPGANGPPDGRGLWQIEWPVWSQALSRFGDPYDPTANARMAREVLQQQGLGAWVVYNTGAYRQFMQKGGLAGRLGKTLSRFRDAKSPKLRRGTVDKLLDRVKKVGLGPGLQKNLKTFSQDANTFGEYADRASALSGDGGPGKVKGKTQAEWLEQELEALFKWRNALVRAEAVVRKRREMVAKAIERARKRLSTVSARLRKLQAHPKANKTAIRALTSEQSALRGRILPALMEKRSGLSSTRGDLLTNLEDVQGLGSPSGVLKRLPALGVLGGRIFDTQMQLRDLRAPTSTITDTSDSGSERAGLLEQLLREANLRTAVSEKQFDVFKNMPQFATGGIVPGASGSAVPAVVHAGEGVFTRDQMAAMGGSTVTVNVAPGMEWLKQFITVTIDQNTRSKSRNADRRLPGRGGGITR